MAGHEHWDELAVGHALGALEPEDEQAFAGHVRDCSQCGRMLADMEAVTAQLAYGVEAAEPPPALRESIMAEVRGSDRVTVVRDRPPVVTPMRRRTPRLPSFDRSWLATAAALVLVVGLAGWNLQLRSDNAAKSRALAVRDAAFRAGIDPAAQSVSLEGPGKPRAEVFVKDGKAWLVVDGFGRNDTSDQVYVLWKDVGGQMHGVNKFDVVHDGVNVIPIGDVGDASQIKRFAVSIEKGRAIPPTPSTPIVLGVVPA
jgi:hypothetical protein